MPLFHQTSPRTISPVFWVSIGNVLTVSQLNRLQTLIPGLMLSNTDYSVCIRSERNFCGIQYTACQDTGKWLLHLDQRQQAF